MDTNRSGAYLIASWIRIQGEYFDWMSAYQQGRIQYKYSYLEWFALSIKSFIWIKPFMAQGNLSVVERSKYVGMKRNNSLCWKGHLSVMQWLLTDLLNKMKLISDRMDYYLHFYKSGEEKSLQLGPRQAEQEEKAYFGRCLTRSNETWSYFMIKVGERVSRFFLGLNSKVVGFVVPTDFHTFAFEVEIWMSVCFHLG